MYRKNLLIVLIALTVLSTKILSQTEVDKIKIDNFIQTVHEKLNLKTGLTIGIVIGERVVFQKGYGFANIEDKVKADVNTPFYIASSTKSFTGALAKILSEADTLDIDAAISDYLPNFQFETDLLDTRTISIRDLLTHRHGIFSIPAVIRTAYTGQYTKEKLFEIYKTPRYTGIEFNYSNDGYVITSLIIDKVMKRPWQDLMQEKIFKPLEMNNTSCKISDFDTDDLPKAYATKNDDIKEMIFLKADNTMHAAGGIVSTTSDLCNWLILNLNKGVYNGSRVLSEKSMEEIHSPQIRLEKSFWEYYRYAYGLGWYLSDYNNEKLIHHFGGYTGARSHISFMPEHNIGVVALTNDDGDGFFAVDLIADYVYNLLTGKDAGKIAEKEIQVIFDSMEKNKKGDEAVEEIPVKSNYNYSLLAGKYGNNEFGEVNVSNGAELIMRFGNLKGKLIPISETSFSVDLSAFKFQVEFNEEEGEVNQVILKGPATLVFDRKK